jgi:hypothetical protein
MKRGVSSKDERFKMFNPLNPELNPICYLPALLAHHFLHVSRIRVKSLTLRLLIIIIIICHGVGPLVDPFRSHVTRSLFKGLPWFLLPVGE